MKYVFAFFGSLGFFSNAAFAACDTFLNYKNDPPNVSKIYFSYPNTDKSLSEYTGLEVQRDGGHPLNLFAASAYDELSGLRMVASRELLGNAGGKAAYAYRQNILFLSEDNLSLDENSISIFHELVHAHIWNQLRLSEPLIFSGLAFNQNPTVQNRAYGPFFGLDEITATIFSIEFLKNKMSLTIADNALETNLKKSMILDASNSLRIYLLRLSTMLGTLGQAIEFGEISDINHPPELDFLSPSIRWKQLRTKDIRIIFTDLIGQQELKKVRSFALSAVSAIDEIDTLTFLLGSTKTFEKDYEKIIITVDSVIREFSRLFPEDFKIIEKVRSY